MLFSFLWRPAPKFEIGELVCRKKSHPTTRYMIVQSREWMHNLGRWNYGGDLIHVRGGEIVVYTRMEGVAEENLVEVEPLFSLAEKAAA